MVNKKIAARKETLHSLIRYLGIGGFVFVLDTAMFQSLLNAGVFRPVATTISYGIAVAVHFTLNKFFSFKSFDRSTASQVRTYLVVVIFSWLMTLVIIEGGVRLLGMPSLWAKILAIVVNIPVGYVCHRYLTFGEGIAAAWRRWQRSLSRR